MIVYNATWEYEVVVMQVTSCFVPRQLCGLKIRFSIGEVGVSF